MDMKKVLFALAMGFALTGCGTVYDTYDGYGYNDYAYGYGTEYIIINNGYSYGYNQGVIDAITNRMILEMALDQARAARLLELNRRYFYIFHSMPNYSFGYYNFNPGPPPAPRGPVGPGYYGGANRPPYGGYGNGRGQGGYRSDYRVNMTDRELENAAKEYTRSVRSIVGNQSYSVFENKVRTDAKAANQKVNAVRVNPNQNALRSNTGTTGSTGATRSRVGNNTSTGTTTAPSSNTNATRVRSNSSSGSTGNAGTTNSSTRVRSNSSSGSAGNAGTTNSSTRVRSNSSSSGSTTTQQSSGSSNRTRVRSNSSSGSTGNTGTTNTTTRVRSNSSSSGSSSNTSTTNTSTRSRTRTK